MTKGLLIPNLDSSQTGQNTEFVNTISVFWTITAWRKSSKFGASQGPNGARVP